MNNMKRYSLDTIYNMQYFSLHKFQLKYIKYTIIFSRSKVEGWVGVIRKLRVGAAREKVHHLP